MLDARRQRGLIDTSVVIDLELIETALLPSELAISAVTLAELAAGPHATDEPGERANRQARLQRIETAFEAIPFDSEAARAYGLLYAGAVAAGRKVRGRRALDLLIAAAAVAANLPLYTRNPDDFNDLGEIITVIGV